MNMFIEAVDKASKVPFEPITYFSWVIGTLAFVCLVEWVSKRAFKEPK